MGKGKILAFALVMSMIMPFATVKAANDNNFVLAQSYESDVTNAAPASGTHNGTDIHVVDNGDGTKSVSMSTYGGEAQALYSFSEKLSGNFCIEFAIRVNGNANGNIVLTNSAGKKATAFILKDKKILAANGYKICGLQPNGFTRVTMESINGIFNIYVNDDEVLSDEYISKMPTSVKAMDMTFEGIEESDAEVLIDSVYAYSGKKIGRNNYPSEEYNPEKTDFTSAKKNDNKAPVTDEECGHAIILAKTFDEPGEEYTAGGLQFGAGNHTMEWPVDKRTGNKYFRYTRDGASGDSLVEFRAGTFWVNLKHVVISKDIRCPDYTYQEWMTVYDELRNSFVPFSVIGGNLYAQNGQIFVRAVPKDKYISVAAAINYVTLTYDLYIDNALVKENLSIEKAINGKAGTVPYNFGGTRVYYPAAGTGTIEWDNYFIYEARKPIENFLEYKKDVEAGKYDNESKDEGGSASAEDKDEKKQNENVPSGEDSENVDFSEYSTWPIPVTNPNKVMENMKGKFAISTVTGTYIANNSRKTLAAPLINESGSLMVPLNELAQELGVSFEQLSDGTGFKINNSEYKYGSDAMNIGGKDLSIAPQPKAIDGNVYFPIRFLGEKILNKNVQYDDRKLIIIADAPVTEECRQFNLYETSKDPYYTNLWDLSDFLLYDWPSTGKMLSLQSSVSSNKHPRVLLNSDDVAEIKRKYNTYPRYKEWGDRYIAAADAYLEKNTPTVLKLPEGNHGEKQYLQPARDILANMYRLGFAYFITGDAKYAQGAFAEIKSAAQTSPWDVNHRIDLGELLMDSALCYDWFYDALSEEQRDLIYTVAEREALDVMDNTLYNWEPGVEVAMQNNRADVMAAGMTCFAAAVLERDPERMTDIIRRTTACVATTNRTWYPDGAWTEGYGYYDYEMQYYVYHVATTLKTFGTDFGLMRALGLSNSIEFLIGGELPLGSFNYGDVGGSSYLNSSRLSFMGYWYNNKEYFKKRISKGDSNLSECDMIWFDPEYLDFNGDMDLPLDNYTRGNYVGSFRSGYNRNAAAIAFKDGFVTTPHGHMDVGTFILEMDGIRWAEDLGAEDYGNTENIRLYRKRPEGHNCIVIAPDASYGQDTEARADLLRFESGARNAFAVIDMSKVYHQYANSAKRGYMLAQDRHSIIIRDEIDIKGKEDVYWFMHTRADIEIVNPYTAILTMDNKKICAQLVSSSLGAKFSVMDAYQLPTSAKASELQFDNSAYKKLAVKLNAAGKQYIEVRFVPVDDPYYGSEMPDAALDDWSLDSGELITSPRVDMIYADGNPVNGFNINENDYSVEISDTVDILPVFSAKADNAVVEVIQPKDKYNPGYVIAHNPLNPDFKTIYTIRLRLLPSTPDLSKLTEYKVENVEVSATPQAENHKGNLTDKDFTTRWSSEGKQWVKLDLGAAKSISKIAMSFMSGNTRSQYFSVELSDDDKDYTKVYDSMSSGKTEALEYYNIGGKKARYIRINFNQTTTGSWNSVTEVGVFGDAN